MSRFPLALLAPIVLSACASGPYYGSAPAPAPGQRPPVAVGPTDAASPLARSASYTCEDLTTVVLTEGQPMAQVTFNSGLVLTLARAPDGRYGAAPYEFYVRGGEATMVNNNKPVRCRAK